MSAPLEALEAGRRPRLARAEGASTAVWGTWLLIVTEGMLFGLLLFVYFYLWSISEAWPPVPVADPDLLVSGIRSLLLFASSATMHIGEKAVKDGGSRTVAAAGFAGTILLAGIFLAGHINEMFKLSSEYLWHDHAYGSIQYTIVNFHAAHLTVGIILIAFVLVRLSRGAYSADDNIQVHTTTMYWHFVDVIWAFVYSSLYIAPNLF